MEQKKTVSALLKGRYGKSIQYMHGFAYIDRCDIYGEKKYADPRTGQQRRFPAKLYSEIPCRLSFREPVQSAERPFPEAAQNVLLFLPPDIQIEPGAVIEVTQAGGRQTRYCSASVPVTYETHLEVALEKQDKKIGGAEWE